MNKKIFPFFVFFLFSGSVVFAQNNYRPGVIVKLDGDTIRGFINYKEWVRNPSSITFVNSINDGKATALQPSDIIYFKVENEEFILFHGQVSMDESSIKLADSPEFRSEEATVFLKIIKSGSFVTLFQYRDKLKTRFFLSYPGNPPEELIYRYFMIVRDGRSGLTEVTQFRNQLRTAANQANVLSKQLATRINKVTYAASTLGSIVDRINGKKNSTSERGGTIFFAGTGVAKTTLSNNHFPSYYYPSYQSTKPFLSGGIDIFVNRKTQRFAFRSELTIGFAKFHNAVYNPYGSPSDLRQTTIGISLQPLYNIFNGKNFKFYIAPGLRINHSSFEGLPQGYGTFPIIHSFVFQAGILIHQNFELNASYIPEWGSELNGEFFKTTRVGIYYHFTKRKKWALLP